MINESIESFLSERSVRDVTATEPQARLHNEYVGYCIMNDQYLPVGIRAFGQYLRFTGRQQVRGRGGRVHYQGIRLTATYNSYNNY